MSGIFAVGVCFNPVKSQCMTFGGKGALAFNVCLNHSVIQWVNKLKYLGYYFAENNCVIDVGAGVRKFSVTSMISRLLLGLNEMATAHLIKTYSLPSVIKRKVDNSQVATSTEYYTAVCRGLPSDKRKAKAMSYTSTLINSINTSKLKEKRTT